VAVRPSVGESPAGAAAANLKRDGIFNPFRSPPSRR